MASTHPCYLLAILAVFVPLVVATGRLDAIGPALGGWNPIKDIKDPHVKEIAEFVVSQYNTISEKKLVLESVLRGETQIVNGVKYRLVMAINDTTSVVNYEAIVYEKIWEPMRRLLSFNLVKEWYNIL